MLRVLHFGICAGLFVAAVSCGMPTPSFRGELDPAVYRSPSQAAWAQSRRGRAVSSTEGGDPKDPPPPAEGDAGSSVAPTGTPPSTSATAAGATTSASEGIASSGDVWAIRLKLADIADNLSRPLPREMLGLHRRYEKAKKVLEAALAAYGET